jgi:hypothetical protein
LHQIKQCGSKQQVGRGFNPDSSVTAGVENWMRLAEVARMLWTPAHGKF